MAPKYWVVLTVILVSIPSMVIGEATTIANPPEAQKAMPTVSPASSPEAPECQAESIKSQLIGTTEKTKGFLNEKIENRLQDKSFGESDKECLMRCFQAYHAAISSIEKAKTDVSRNKFSDAIVDVVAYLSFIGSTMKLKCTSNVILQNPEFAGMAKWAESSAQAVLKQLKICSK